jgi:Phasin protein
MAEQKSHAERTEKSTLNLMPTEFAEMGKKRFEAFANIQSELLGKLSETNRHWFDRAQAEAHLASEFASKLTSAHSIPEAMAAYQEWTGHWFELMAEDGKHLLADAQEFMKASARLLSNGGLINGNGGLST